MLCHVHYIPISHIIYNKSINFTALHPHLVQSEKGSRYTYIVLWMYKPRTILLTFGWVNVNLYWHTERSDAKDVVADYLHGILLPLLDYLILFFSLAMLVETLDGSWNNSGRLLVLLLSYVYFLKNSLLNQYEYFLTFKYSYVRL